MTAALNTQQLFMSNISSLPSVLWGPSLQGLPICRNPSLSWTTKYNRSKGLQGKKDKFTRSLIIVSLGNYTFLLQSVTITLLVPFGLKGLA